MRPIYTENLDFIAVILVKLKKSTIDANSLSIKLTILGQINSNQV